MSLYAIHRFIERLDRDTQYLGAFRADPRKAMTDAGLSDDEREKLWSASRETLTELGINPLLQIRFLLARFPERGSFMSVKEWAGRLPLEVNHG